MKCVKSASIFLFVSVQGVAVQAAAVVRTHQGKIQVWKI